MDQKKAPYSLVYTGEGHGPGEVRDIKAVLLPWLGSAGAEMKQTSGFGPDCIKTPKSNTNTQKDSVPVSSHAQ